MDLPNLGDVSNTDGRYYWNRRLDGKVGVTVNIKVILWSLTLLFTSSAQATLVQQFKGFSVANGVSGLSFFTFDPFDTALGRLDRVTFNIQGTVSLNASATSNFGGGFLGLVPYDYTLKMDMNLFSTGGFNFDFSNDAQFYFTGTDSGLGDSFVQARGFSLTAEFDEFTDNFGFAIPTNSNTNYIPPVTITSSRRDFEENLITSSLGLQFQMLNIWSIVSSSAITADITPTGRSAGFVTLNYDYTPIPEVPVPAAIWLFGTGLLGLIGVKWRRKAGS